MVCLTVFWSRYMNYNATMLYQIENNKVRQYCNIVKHLTHVSNRHLIHYNTIAVYVESRYFIHFSIPKLFEHNIEPPIKES